MGKHRNNLFCLILVIIIIVIVLVLVCWFFTRNQSKNRQGSTYYIYNSDLGNTGVVLDRPGEYIVRENLLFDPKDTKNNKKKCGSQQKVLSALTIGTRNVVINLGPFSLKQRVPKDPKQQRPFVVGILVPDLAPDNTNINFRAVQSVTIKGENAVISDFSMYGLKVFG